MAEYIELINRLRQEAEFEAYLQPHSANETPKLLSEAADAIEKLNDVQPVVLCRDCEYCRKEDEFEHWCYGFCSPARLVRKDDFCSHGKAKE